MTAVSDPNPPSAPPDARLRPVNRRDRRWWTALILVVVLSFGVLLFMGNEIRVNKPPYPTQVVDTNGTVLMTDDDIMKGQQVWQSIGGQQIGSVWGHGAYVAPDWTADILHRELTYVLDAYARAEGAPSYDALDAERQAALKERLKTSVRTNTYDPATGTVTIDVLRAEAWELNSAHYAQVFSEGNEQYAIPAGALTDPEHLQQMSDFFWWSAWAAETDAPGKDATYTQNWPHEPLIDNVPTPTNILWSIISFILLLGGIAGLVWYHNYHADDDEKPRDVPTKDPLLGYRSTPSQRATIKYFYVVGALFVVQIAMGIISAHYGVEGGALYGIPIDEILPYAVTRTWHTQLGILWIATTWLATGLYVAPAVGGAEPKYQRLGVNVLFWALILVVAGSMLGQWLSIMGHMGYGNPINWWLGTTGMEYLDLARVWQIGLLVGLFLWLFLMARGMWPALQRARSGEGNRPTATAPLAAGGQRTLVIMLLLSALAIAGFFGAAFGMGRSGHLSITEYWRWWVVHLWVEGFFEVFATTALAFVFSSMGLVSRPMATAASLASASLFMLGGIPGTFHHLYFAGTTTPVMAVGAAFSALEVVPLIVLGHEAWENWRLKTRAPWMDNLKWPLLCFVAVAFWNMLGAGVFGFMINPPISLYYVQGLNTTPVHAHAALFGVYGFLALGFTLLVLRYVRPQFAFSEGLMKTAFWGLNGGLVLMIATSLLPVGIIQFMASASEGLWYARSEAFMQQPLLQTLRWVRTFGDVVFIIGAVALAWQVVIGLAGGRVAGQTATRQALGQARG